MDVLRVLDALPSHGHPELDHAHQLFWHRYVAREHDAAASRDRPFIRTYLSSSLRGLQAFLLSLAALTNGPAVRCRVCGRERLRSWRT